MNEDTDRPVTADDAEPAVDIDPATPAVEDEDEARLPEPADDAETAPQGTLAIGRSAIARAVRLAPASAGVYRMLNAAGDVLYVGKAKSVKKPLAS